MKLTSITIAAAAATLLAVGPLHAADKAQDEQKAEKQRIEQEARAARDQCKDMKGSEKNLCMAEARGNEKVARAELALKQNDTPKNRYEVAAAKADMEYNVAKAKCDAMKGKEKDSCQKEAKAARDNARKTAKAEREAAEPRKEARAKKDA